MTKPTRKTARKTAPTSPQAPIPDSGEPPIRCSHSAVWTLADIRPNPRNPNRHPADQIALLAKVIAATGWRNPIVVSLRSNLVVKGHGRLAAAAFAGWRTAPVDLQPYESDADELADLIADNKIAELAEMDADALAVLVAELTAGGLDPELAGILEATDPDETDAERRAAEKQKIVHRLKDRFIVSPYTVIDSRTGTWLQRKQLWKALIPTKVGRQAELTTSVSAQPPTVYNLKNRLEAEEGREITWKEMADRFPELYEVTTSAFDPVLAEIVFSWFLPLNQTAHILDPFAGGPTAGIVAAILGHRFTGYELRADQVAANYEAAAQLWRDIGDPKHKPEWIHGDCARLIPERHPQPTFDLVFSSPPYGDLEVYSDLPEDLSNMDADTFRATYARILTAVTQALKPRRCLALMVGDYRDSRGNYAAFPHQTVELCKANGLAFMNQAVILTPTGSAPIRAGRVFASNRKLLRIHGDAKFLWKGSVADLRTTLQTHLDDLAVFYKDKTTNKVKEEFGALQALDIVPLGDLITAEATSA